MTERVLGPTGSRRRKRLLVLLPIAMLAALVFTLSGSALTDANVGFQGSDGNLDPNNPAAPPNFDWNSFSPVTWSPHPSTDPTRQTSKTANGVSPTAGPWTFKGLEDWEASTDDSAFSGGTKQDEDCPGVIDQKPDNKADLKRIYIASTTATANSGDSTTGVVAGDVILALAWVRIPQNTTSPSAHVAFEFNQADPAVAANQCGSGSDSLVHRTVGDMLVVYDFEGGSTDTPIISLSRWVGSGACEISNHSPPCWGTYANATASGKAEAKVNTFGSVSDSLTPPALSDTGGVSVTNPLSTSEFGEAVVNLSSLGVFPRGTPTSCTTFGEAFGVSRTSGNSGTAQMKDLVGPGPVNITNCGTVIIHKQTDPTSDTTTSFSFSKNFNTDPSTLNTFSLTGGNCATTCGTQTYSGTVLPKTDARVTESDPSGSNYLLTNITCTAGSTATNVARNATTGIVGGVPARTVEFDLAPGQTLECTFFNTRQKVQSSMDTAPWIYPNDKATVNAAAGQTNINGTVEFKLYGATTGPAVTALQNCNANGATGLLYAQTVTLTGTATSKTVNTSNPGGGSPGPTSVKIELTATSPVYWRVEYSGDSNHFGRLSNTPNCVENINATLTGDTGGTNVP